MAILMLAITVVLSACTPTMSILKDAPGLVTTEATETTELFDYSSIMVLQQP